MDHPAATRCIRPGDSAVPTTVLGLQRTVGNRATVAALRLLSRDPNRGPRQAHSSPTTGCVAPSPHHDALATALARSVTARAGGQPRAALGARLLQRSELPEGTAGKRPNPALGDTGPGVNLLQRLLGAKRTGVFDAATRGAVDEFQRQIGTSPGPLDAATWDRIENHAGTPGNRPSLWEGDRGPAVRLLQEKLGIKQTSVFDQATRKRVDAFQLKQNWEPSGVGPLTWAALENPSGPKARPTSAEFWSAYEAVNYDKKAQGEVWDFVGGSVGKDFAGGNTCATRVSVGLNEGGWKIPTPDNRGSYRNESKKKYKGKPGDDKVYIVRASTLVTHLTKLMGPPDVTLKQGSDATALEASLSPGQIAVFAGVHHAGVIKAGYKDPYVFTDSAVLPADAWRLR